MSPDIVECVENPEICGPDANCTNLIGSHNCTCHSGYRLNNLEVIASITNPCTGARTKHSFHSSFLGSEGILRPCWDLFGSNFADIDECVESPGICGKNTVCTNVPGTFFCSCPDGFYPSTGIFWIVGTSFCKSEQNKLQKSLKLSKMDVFLCTVFIF